MHGSDRRFEQLRADLRAQRPGDLDAGVVDWPIESQTGWSRMNCPLPAIFLGLTAFDSLFFAETVNKPCCRGACYAQDLCNLTAEATRGSQHDPQYKTLRWCQPEFCIDSCPLPLYETGEGGRIKVKAVIEHETIKSHNS